MKHLDFAIALDKNGISIRTTNVENKEKRIIVQGGKQVIIKNYNVEYAEKPVYEDKTALQEIIKKAIDADTWKYSQHSEISPENYAKFIEIIQEIILQRASEIEELVSIYFQLHHEIFEESQTKQLNNQTK